MNKKVTGIGGIFVKCNDPAAIKSWYAQHLGITTDEYGGATFEWRKADNPEELGCTLWTTFKKASDYFQPSEKDFMINFRVENLKALVEELKAAGIEPLGEIQEYDFGSFAHIVDLEGTKIELWEPK